MNPEPRYRPIVRAFAGDSTITSLPRAVVFRGLVAVDRFRVVDFFAVDRVVVGFDRVVFVPVSVSTMNV